jgi:hypothetical protein
MATCLQHKSQGYMFIRRKMKLTITCARHAHSAKGYPSNSLMYYLSGLIVFLKFSKRR